MKQTYLHSLFAPLHIILLTLVITSCVPNVQEQKNTRSKDSSNAIFGSVKVGLYQGRVLEDNPIILSRDANLSDSYDLNRLLTTTTITSNSFLKGNSSCNGLTYCFEVRAIKESPSALQTSDGKWGFNANTPEFLQVNTFYHLNTIMNLFFSDLTKSFARAYVGTTSTTNYDTSLPRSIQNISTNVFSLISNPLIAYADCNEADNAFFSHATQTLCFGFISEHPKVKWAQDSTVIYHETGHFLQKVQLNLRNSLTGPRVDMGNSSYDEAASIGEGLSDYYSYFINGRTHFAEWGAGRFLNADRPISESDSIYPTGISTDPDQRLSYPQFVSYDPNTPSNPTEDVHASGKIISHYLVALTEDLQEKCLMSRREASDLVIHFINETLAEHGDLSSNGIQGISSGTHINNRAAYSADWYRLVNPITYRSFMQTFAKNLKNDLFNSSLNRCKGSVYQKDQIEYLIDQYGLLLFRTYNENRNASGGTLTAVNSVNRKKSVLISKNLIILDPTPNANTAFVIDDRESIKGVVAELQTGSLLGSLSAQTPSDFGFNNDNGKMSPGEVVAVALNLYNNSNSPMGGVQVLANNWRHADNSGNPYQFPASMSTDRWPLLAEGGVLYNDAVAITAASSTDFAPVCFIQANEATGTKWISQSTFKTNMALNSSLCLDPNKTNECFIRALKGADQANYSKIDAKKTWGQTFADPETGAAPTFKSGNMILFEVSKHIPPGTVVDCRLRVRFTNCEDCYHDTSNSNDDYTDAEYNGPRPFKIIHLQIPIID